jgi:hypothetical protein
MARFRFSQAVMVLGGWVLTKSLFRRSPVRVGRQQRQADRKTFYAPHSRDQKVDEAIDESFPASDPPSWTPVSSSGAGTGHRG